MKYKILNQHFIDERLFEIRSLETGEQFTVDFYTDGQIDPPAGADETAKSWRAWLKSFEGKIIEIERLTPSSYFSAGETRIIEE